jgi:hypothetical protein
MAVESRKQAELERQEEDRKRQVRKNEKGIAFDKNDAFGSNMP